MPGARGAASVGYVDGVFISARVPHVGRREHVLAVVLVRAFSDALLITLGVLGVGTLVQGSPVLLTVARYGGAAFLTVYGAPGAAAAWRWTTHPRRACARRLPLALHSPT